MKKTLAALVLTTAWNGAAAAQINKCLDASGKAVAYGAECPAGTRAESTNIRNTPAASAPAEKSLAERDADFRKRQAQRQEAEAKSDKKSAEAAQRSRACEDARSYLRSLQSGERIRTTDPKTGERGYLADTQYPKEIARAQQAVGDHCK